MAKVAFFFVFFFKVALETFDELWQSTQLIGTNVNGQTEGETDRHASSCTNGQLLTTVKQCNTSDSPLSLSQSLYVCSHFAALTISESLNLCYGAKHFRPDCKRVYVCVCERLQLQLWLIKSILIDHFATKSICNVLRMFSIIRTISLIAWQTSSSKKNTNSAKRKGDEESKSERDERKE